MKNHLLVLLLVILSVGCFGQDTIKEIPTHSQIFSLSPISKKVDEVNGLAFGVGHVENKNIEKQTVNGLNIEVNPAPVVGAFVAVLYLMYLPEIIEKNRKYGNKKERSFIIENENTILHLKIKGLNVSTGCFFTTTNVDGLNVSLCNKFKNFNGLSITPLGAIADTINGFSIGVVNANTALKGATFSIYSQTYELKGLQAGIVNQVEKNKGIQIGLYNKSYSRGLQLGIWNKNSSRSFPLINW